MDLLYHLTIGAFLSRIMYKIQFDKLPPQFISISLGKGIVMKIYTKIILDKDNRVIEEEYFNYFGPLSYCGIHYDFKSTRGAKAMEKQAKREKKLAEKRAKKQAKALEKGIMSKVKEDDKTIPLTETITLAHLTDPENNKK